MSIFYYSAFFIPLYHFEEYKLHNKLKVLSRYVNKWITWHSLHLSLSQEMCKSIKFCHQVETTT